MEVINIDDSDDEQSRSNNRPVFNNNNNNNNVNDDNYEYRIMLLMDHREYGNQKQKRAAKNYRQEVEERVNRVFNGRHCEILSLKAADYMFTVRKISNATGEVVDERLFDLIIERKDVGDLASCLIIKSKNYEPLSFFEAQMHKLVNCGIKRKIFLIEGDEDTQKWLTKDGKPAAKDEQDNRKLRIKTTRLLVQHGHFNGVEIVCTKWKDRTAKFLIHQMKRFRNTFDPSSFDSMKTMQQFADHINEKMNDSTFKQYLSLRQQPRVGDKKAMKVIRGPNLNWDKSFVSPAEKNGDIKAILKDRPTYWDPRKPDEIPPQLMAPRPQPGEEEEEAGDPPPTRPQTAENDRISTTSNSRNSSISRSASNVSSSSNNSSSSAATSNGSPRGGASASSTSSNGNASARSNAKTTGEESQGKKRDASKKTSYKKRQKVSEKLYIRPNPNNLKSSHSARSTSAAAKESASISQNQYIAANPLHDTNNSFLEEALLDDRKPAAKSSVKDSVRNRQPYAPQSGSQSGNKDFEYMLEFSDDDDVEGKVVAVPTPKGKKRDAGNAALTSHNASKKCNTASSCMPKSKSKWYDDYKDVLESSDDDSDSMSSSGKQGETTGKSKQSGVKKSNDDEVIVIDSDDDVKSTTSVIDLLD